MPNVPHQKLKSVEKIQYVPFHMLLFVENFLKSAKNPQKLCALGRSTTQNRKCALKFYRKISKFGKK